MFVWCFDLFVSLSVCLLECCSFFVSRLDGILFGRCVVGHKIMISSLIALGRLHKS